jgi:ParB family chromosome partitioning protein
METQIIHVPLSRLSPIAHGVRKTNGVAIDDLAASIKAEGLLQNLTIVRDRGSPLDGAIGLQSFHVIAGCRRLRALRHLVDTKQLPDDYTVPCRLIAEAQALSASLAENAIRVQMHPADEFTAFRELVDEGKSIEDIAARFGCTPLFVQRRLKLANVSPKIFELFRTTKEISLEQMMALAIVDNHKAQEAAWFKSETWAREPQRLRALLVQKEIDASRDPLARFVGVSDYERAGGAVRKDLFNEKSAYISDALLLLKKLAAEKLEAAAAEVRKEAWSFVEIRDKLDYAELGEYTAVPATGKRKPTDVERKRMEELQAEADKAGKRFDQLEKKSEGKGLTTEEEAEAGELEDRVNAINEQIASIDAGLQRWDPKILAKGGAIVTIDHAGELDIRRGLVKGKVKVAKEQTAKSKKAKDKKIAEGAGHSDALVRELSAAVSFAVTAECIANPGMAIIALTEKLLLANFYRSSFDHKSPVTISTREQTSPQLTDSPDAGGNPDIAKFAAEQKAINAMLPKKAGELFDWLCTKDAPVSRLLAYCAAVSIDTVIHSEQAANNWSAKRLAGALKLDMSTRWTPNVENYASRVSSAMLIAAMKESGNADATTLEKAKTLKKADLIKVAQPILAGAGWVPKLLRFAAKSGASE